MTISSVDSNSLFSFQQTKSQNQKSGFDKLVSATPTVNTQPTNLVKNPENASPVLAESSDLAPQTSTTPLNNAATTDTAPAGTTVSVADRVQDLMSQFFNNTGVFTLGNSPSNYMDRIQFLMANINQIVSGLPLLTYSPPSITPVANNPVPVNSSIDNVVSTATPIPYAPILQATASTPAPVKEIASNPVLNLPTKPAPEFIPVTDTSVKSNPLDFKPFFASNVNVKADIDLDLLKNGGLLA